MESTLSSFMVQFMGVQIGVLLILFAVGLGSIFFFGLMLYFFTGDKSRGDKLISNLMRSAARIYNNVWMFFGAFTFLYGLSLLFKVLFGAIFAGFVYAEKTFTKSSNLSQTDLQMGVILTIFAVILFGVHWGFSYMMDTVEERKGTITSKVFSFFGLQFSSLLFFGGMLMFVLELLQYVMEGASTFGVKPGGSLALMLGALPVWAYYVARVMMQSRSEQK